MLVLSVLVLSFLSTVGSSCVQTLNHRPKIALTRAVQENHILEKLLTARGIPTVQLPCIEFVPKEDITDHHFTQCDIIAVTSAQGASRVGKSWNGQLTRPVASVGFQTSEALRNFGIIPAFEPSDATAHHLGSELPTKFGKRVLYPTSNLAASTLEDLLVSRGFLVTRLNVYDTKFPFWEMNQLEEAKKVDIVAFFSPSAVSSWAEKVGRDHIAVTLGPSTTAKARELNFREVQSCQSIGVESVVDLLEKCYHST